MNSIILTDEEKLNGVAVEDAHPIEYVQARTMQLKGIQENIQVQRMFKPKTGIDNLYINGLFGEYKRKHEDIQNRRIEQLKYLNPNHFDTIFNDSNATLKRTKQTNKPKNIFAAYDDYHGYNDNDNDEDEEQEELSEKQIKQLEKQKNQLYTAYIEGSELDQDQVIGTVFGREVTKGEQVIYSAVEQQKEKEDVRELLTLKREWLYELNQEITQIHNQNKRIARKANRSEVCQNQKIVQKLAASLFTQFHVYFDDIFDALMDDILEEEVEYFNEVEGLEAAAAAELAEKKPSSESMKLKEVVRNSQLSTNLFGLIDQLDSYAADMPYHYNDDY